MRFLARSLGLFLAAAAFVAVVVDGTRSIADNRLVFLPVRSVWLWLSPKSFEHMRNWVEASLSGFVWNNLASPLLGLPFALLLVLICALLFWLGRPPASRIGYVSHL
ncbi:PetM family of cytochrome b6f complex subunit 7 [Labrys neptuniae]